MSKKKVAILGTAYPLRGGLAAYNERLAKAYTQQGYEVKIFTFSLQYPNFLFPGKTQFSDEPKPDLDIDICVNSINPLNWISVGRKIKKWNPDLLIIKYWLPFMAPCFGRIARIVKRNKKTKIVSILDNIIPHEKRFADRALSNYFVKSVDGFVAMSDSVMKDLETFDNKKPLQFCPHPLYDNFGEVISQKKAQKKLNLDSDYKYLLFFGFIRDYKGLDLLLKAMSRLKDNNHKIKLIVAGEFYSNEKTYLDLIEELKIKEQLVLATDFIPDSKVSLYFSAADLIVQPYKSATQSGVTQIAYHFEKPIITTDVGGLAEIVPDGKVGYVVQPNEVEIADAITKFFREANLEEMRENIKNEKKKYSWERLLETLDKTIIA